MEKGIFVKDISERAPVSGVFLIDAASQALTKGGRAYWNLRLADATGSVDAKLWHPLSTSFPKIDKGALASVKGRAELFRERIQVNIEAFAPLAEDVGEADWRLFTRVSPRDPGEMFRELRQLCLQEFRHPHWRKLVLAILGDAGVSSALQTIPAAKNMHHAYRGGLLEHTLSVFNLCRSICDRYPSLDRQTLLAGALLHDIGKIREFSGGLNNDYTDVGRLVGHIVLGASLLEPFLRESELDERLKEHLVHLILSHHGEYEYGAARLPQTAEAFVLHYADNLDAKLAQFANLFNDDPSREWSDYQRGLDRFLFNPFRTPDAPRESRARDAECLSLLKE